ncbi:MAG TPA: NEW3 domain-containing protein [Stellaceae bacterium]|nr:NEW3 domain-containing protein [Stellaceae bacterium]
MHRAFRFLGALSFLALVAAAPPPRAAEPTAATAPAHIKGLWLTTDYPSVAARAGETTTIKMKLQNVDLAPERVQLSLDGVPAGWSAVILGGSTPVAAAMPATNDNVPLSLRVDVPANAPAGTLHLIVHAKSGAASADLPIDIATGQDLPAQLAIKPKLPSLNGTPTTSFEFQFTVTNQSDKDLLVKVAAKAPQGFQTSFMEAYGTQELSSIPIEAGKDKDLKVKVTPPANVTAGDYPVAVQASAEGAAAETQMQMSITGVSKLKISGEEDRLNAEAEAGATTPIKLTVQNTGSAPATDVELSASPPSSWKVTFQPDKIDTLAPNQKRDVQALLTPSSKAIAGDYMTTFRANGKGDSSSADFRITVATSSMWGMVGIGIIAIAFLVLIGAVARFGRR